VKGEDEHNRVSEKTKHMRVIWVAAIQKALLFSMARKSSEDCGKTTANDIVRSCPQKAIDKIGGVYLV